MEHIAITNYKSEMSLIYAFLNSIDISFVEKEIHEPTFLPGLKIENGCLIVDKNKLLYPGDILHEAGHIAVTEASQRNSLNDNVTDNRPGSEGEELAAMLWSYAACIDMKVSPKIVFHEHGYKGDSEWILNNYQEKNYIGLPLLIWMGMTREQPDANGFPKMIKWIRN